MIRLGTIGSGWIVDCFLSGCESVPAITHTAVYSRTKERGTDFAAKHGLSPAAVFTDLTEMAESGLIDAVYIASPNRFHAPQAEVFLSRGIHVILEKPITVNTAELDRLQTLADQKGVILLEALMSVHQPRFAALRSAMEQIGKISGAELNFSQLSSKYPALLRGELPNIFNPTLAAGALMDIGVYNVALAAALFGRPKGIMAMADFLPTGADGLGYALFRYDWGICSLNWSKTAQTRTGSEILGDKGTITFDPVSRILHIDLHHPDGSITPIFGEESHAESMGHEAADFVRYIEDPTAADEYRRYVSLSRLTAELMEEIRTLCGIRFPEC